MAMAKSRAMHEKLTFSPVANREAVLVDHVDREQYRPFEVGIFDCALWGADCLKVQTGYDIAAAWRGKYKTIPAGMKLVKKDGFADHVDVFAQQMYEVPSSMAHFGDLVVVEGLEGMMSVGVCMGHIIYAPTQTTMGVAHLSQVMRAFRVIRVEGDDAYTT